MKLKNKRILITAGPTWVPIDKVRVISNIATGKTGILLAKQAKGLGADVTLILGPVGEINLSKSIKIIRFHFFDELLSLIKKELKRKKYDIVIHSAAVSDYKTKKPFSEKIESNIKDLSLELEATVKIADKIKKFSPGVFLTIFKLELNLFKEKMISKARKTMQESDADLAVLNTFSDRYPYRALIIDKQRFYYQTNSKDKLVKRLLQLVSAKFN